MDVAQKIKIGKDICKAEFNRLDPEGNGVVDRYELRAVIKSILEDDSEDSVNKFMVDLDDDGCGQVVLDELLRAYEQYMNSLNNIENDDDTYDAWLALGGDEDKEGTLEISKLTSVVQNDFKMTIDVPDLVRRVSGSNSSSINYKTFSTLFY